MSFGAPCIVRRVAEICFKVYQLRNGSRVAKKKTSFKRDDNNPTFNEAMIFSAPQHMIEVSFMQCLGRNPLGELDGN